MKITQKQFALLKIVSAGEGNFNPAYSSDLDLPRETMRDTLSDLRSLIEKGYIDPMFHSRYDVQAYFRMTQEGEKFLEEEEKNYAREL
jgi:hypothetical protein